eukprot:6325136-Pyramimonas_sp.AAC.1
MGLAVKMPRDGPTAAVAEGFNGDAAWAVDEEVRRRVALGSPPNFVRIVDVGLFRQLTAKGESGLQQSQRDLGLVGPHRPLVRAAQDRRAPVPLRIRLHTVGRHSTRPDQRS